MPTFLLFVPFIIFSMVCMAIWCFVPRLCDYFAVRLGLYTGVLIAGTFSVLSSILTHGIQIPVAMILACSIAFIVWCVELFAKKYRRFSIQNLLLVTALSAVFFSLILVLAAFDKSIVTMVAVIPFLVIVSAPVLSTIAYLRASIIVCHGSWQSNPQPAFLHWIGGWLFWIGGMILTWKFAIDSMLMEYSQLPPNPPQGCYVSSAAAHGHAKFVGASTDQGSPGKVNSQMKRLKFLEFVLAAVCPGVHRAIRRIYNRVGPPLASFCQHNIWFADATFVLLKPLEWTAIGLQLVLRIPASRIEKLYRS